MNSTKTELAQMPLKSCSKHSNYKRLQPSITSFSVRYTLPHNSFNDVDVVDGDSQNK